MTLSEEELKSCLLAKFRRERRITASSIIASEFVLGQTSCRSDLAIWNGAFIGVEVKSARDNLSRLPSQMRAYHKFFDEVILVCDASHLDKAQVICDEDVGIYVWRDRKLELAREAAPNSKIDRRECVRSLTVKQLYSGLDIKTTSRHPRPQLEDRLVADLSIDVRALVLKAFEATYQTTSEAFFREVSGRRILPNHLVYLSRFAESRSELKSYKDAREGFWRQWELQAQVVFG
ncbi:MAG: hypothetical protein DI528_21555 [Shinella sp.]|nr:MAG: hypothetical protein DI528_21555 [Shinella sp.]